MSINVIIPTILIASTSYVQPVFHANYIEPVARVNYVEAVCAVNYLQVQVTAEVTMPDVLAVDIITPTDLVTLSTEKALTDKTNGFSDLLAKATAKSFSDSVSETDVLKRTFGKKLTDLQTMADAKQISFGKALADIAHPADLISKSTVKTLADSISVPVDLAALAINKALAESATLSDAISTVLVFIRTFSDTALTADVANKAFQLNKIDSINNTDLAVKQVTKGANDGISIVDNMDGDLTYAFVKVIGELLLSSDTQVVDFSSNKADNVTASSSGVLAMQDYCDITYFLEDYVGISRTFT